MAVEGYDVVRSEVTYDSGFTRIRVDDVRMPDGDVTTREVVEQADAVAAVAVDDDGAVVLVRQYRHPLGQRCLELPAGKLDVDGEDPQAALRRELVEEAALAAGKLERLATFANSAGWADERTTVYLATELRDAPRPEGFSAAHEEADLDVLRMPLDDALALVDRGDITDGKTIIGLLLAARRRAAVGRGPTSTGGTAA